MNTIRAAHYKFIRGTGSYLANYNSIILPQCKPKSETDSHDFITSFRIVKL